MPGKKIKTRSEVVRVAGDIKDALDKNLLARFQAMSPSHRREWVRAIDEAKKPETRQRRIEQLVAKMRAND